MGGAKNLKAISSTKLRKHLATLTQLFNMTENDIEQLSNFMGHTTGVHRRNYRLPDDIYQTVKISKLLLLMEDGKADAYKGKSLDEINLNMEEELEGETINNFDIIEYATNIADLGSSSTAYAQYIEESSTAATDNSQTTIQESTALQNITNIGSTAVKTKKGT